MEKRTKKILLVSGTLLLVGGAFWLWWRNRKPKEEENVPLATDDSGTSTVTTPSGNVATGSGPSDVRAFQDWMDKNHPNWVKGKNLNKGSGYGTYGPSTQAAWNTYKAEYQKGSAPTNTVNPSVKPIFVPAKDVLSSDINGAYKKTIYAGGEVKVFNMGNELAFTVKKGDYIGLVTSARVSGSQFIIYILKNNVKYYLQSPNVLVKTK
jgi:hypothetical protein